MPPGTQNCRKSNDVPTSSTQLKSRNDQADVVCGRDEPVFAANAGYSQDSGIITQIFVTPEGAIALNLDTGSPNPKAAGQCAAGDGHWAGIATANPVFKATLLTAKSAGSQVFLTTLGCEGGWFKIMDMYVK